HPGAVVAARVIGVLMMEDEAGVDEKILAVPTRDLTKRFDRVNDYTDIAEIMLDRISHFFEQYKALEPNKWVKVIGWRGIEEAEKAVTDAIERYNKEAK
ncbi:MAG: inorganic diphosphatase, partial [Gammaproteobacteria bacterium]|nr:inorganic diphosphatase [Gammaproteobacteria bacterium]